jgi:hypothetical protein
MIFSSVPVRRRLPDCSCGFFRQFAGGCRDIPSACGRFSRDEAHRPDTASRSNSLNGVVGTIETSPGELAALAGVARQTISSSETGEYRRRHCSPSFSPTCSAQRSSRSSDLGERLRLSLIRQIPLFRRWDAAYTVVEPAAPTAYDPPGCGRSRRWQRCAAHAAAHPSIDVVMSVAPFEH